MSTKLRQRIGDAASMPVIESAATTKWHEDEPPTSLAIRSGESRGYMMSRMRARPVLQADFDRFVWIFAMTREHRKWLQDRKPVGSSAQIMLFSALAPQLGMSDIPDPWGGDSETYDQCLNLIEIGCDGMVDRLVGGTPGPFAASQDRSV